MKTILLLTLMSLQPAFAQAKYSCISTDGTEALLTIDAKKDTILWQDLTHSADTSGIFEGIDEAEFSNEKGYLLYLASDYQITNDSAWYYKLEPDYVNQGSFKVVEVFNNDGHEEFETVFKCQ